jgi:hypothetical protein
VSTSSKAFVSPAQFLNLERTESPESSGFSKQLLQVPLRLSSPRLHWLSRQSKRSNPEVVPRQLTLFAQVRINSTSCAEQGAEQVLDSGPAKIVNFKNKNMLGTLGIVRISTSEVINVCVSVNRFP